MVVASSKRYLGLLPFFNQIYNSLIQILNRIGYFKDRLHYFSSFSSLHMTGIIDIIYRRLWKVKHINLKQRVNELRNHFLKLDSRCSQLSIKYLVHRTFCICKMFSLTFPKCARVSARDRFFSSCETLDISKLSKNDVQTAFQIGPTLNQLSGRLNEMSRAFCLPVWCQFFKNVLSTAFNCTCLTQFLVTVCIVSHNDPLLRVHVSQLQQWPVNCRAFCLFNCCRVISNSWTGTCSFWAVHILP